MPSQADEEAHQLSYLQKHLANILSLLADTVEGEGEESLVCNLWILRYLSFICLSFYILLFYPLKVEINHGEVGDIRKANTCVLLCFGF